MGILDEAIREHLDLKRRHGAAESELKQLEDEAFGPPARPGEPDFPESEMSTAGAEPVVEEQLAEPIPVAEEGPPAEHPIVGEPTAVEEAVAEEPAAVEEPPVAEELPVAEEPPAAEEPPPTDEAGPPEDQTALYDRDAGTELKLEDLDLDLEDEEPVPPEPAATEQAGGQQPPESAEPPGERPIESLDTVEHEYAEEEAEPEAPPAEDEGDEEGDEDVLADTPEFLKDAPEDDELWFEQGSPKDFDF